MSADPELEKCFSIDNWNAFGFQYDCNTDGKFIIARISQKGGDHTDEDAIAKYAGDKTGSKTVSGRDFLGYKFVEVHYTEWELIPAVFQCLIDRGDLWVATHTNCSVGFEKGETFSFHEMERKRVEYLLAERKQWGSWRKVCDIQGKWHVYLKNFNWHTKEGKDLCVSIRAELKPGKPQCKTKYGHYVWKGVDATCRKHKALWHGVWSGYKPSALTVDDLIPLEETATTTSSAIQSTSSTTNQTVPAVSLPSADTKKGASPKAGDKRKADDDDDDNAESVMEPMPKRATPVPTPTHPHEEEELIEECFICLTNEPDTVVLPCMHKVVCGECSKKLSTTNDKHTCVRCRRPITDVLYDAK